jgi:DinB family protein
MSKGWVCPICGIDYGAILVPDAKAAMLSYPRRYRELLPPRDDDPKPDAVIRRRPEPTVWSALEYTMHVADVADAIAGIVRDMVAKDHPSLTMFDPDERAADARYNDEDREVALDKLSAACTKMADGIDDVPRDAWSRTATFPWGERDVLTMTRNAVHEGYHHLRDVADVLTRVVGRPVEAPED